MWIHTPPSLWAVHYDLLCDLCKPHDMDSLVVILLSWADTHHHANLSLAVKVVLEKVRQFGVTIRNNLFIKRSR